jgi:hypothetical protein
MGFFDSRYKFRVHMLQICIVLGAIGVSVVRLFIKTNVTVASSKSRANTMALGVVRKNWKYNFHQTDINSGCQILDNHSLRSLDGAWSEISEVGQPQSEHDSQHLGDSLLGCGCFHGCPSKHPKHMLGDQVHAELGCCCAGYYLKVRSSDL